jgi:hypothetical protein
MMRHGLFGGAYRLGLRNLNGGDPRMDAHFPSYAHLVPPVHLVGGMPQYFTSAANDYILTDEWKPPYYRFRNVIQTFERAGAPRRIVPIDVYFHYYSARNITALTALKGILDWVTWQPVAPLFASQYVDIVRDAQAARLARISPREWMVQKGPSLRTVRFDDPEVHIDVNNSRGVLGYLQDHQLSVTYVHLDNEPTVLIRLGSEAPRGPYLERASHVVDDLVADDDEISWRTRGPGKRTFVFAGLSPRDRWRLGNDMQSVDEKGRLTVTTAGRQPGEIAMRIRRGNP